MLRTSVPTPPLRGVTAVLAGLAAVVLANGVAVAALLPSTLEAPPAIMASAAVADPAALPLEGAPAGEAETDRASRSDREGAAAPAEPPPAPAAPPAAPPAPPAPAAPPAPSCEGPEARGQRVLATLPDAWRSTGMPVVFSGPREGLYGEVRPYDGTVNIYVRSCRAESDSFLRHVIAHELGHAHDITFMDDALRAEYRRARGLPDGVPWFGCSGCTDLATPAGDFAETYGQWLRGGSGNKSRLAPPASAAALADLGARFFAR